MIVIMLGFEEIKQEYAEGRDFGRIYSNLLHGEQAKHPHFSIHDGCLFKGTKLHLPTTYIHKHNLQEIHAVDVADICIVIPLPLLEIGIFGRA